MSNNWTVVTHRVCECRYGDGDTDGPRSGAVAYERDGARWAKHQARGTQARPRYARPRRDLESGLGVVADGAFAFLKRARPSPACSLSGAACYLAARFTRHIIIALAAVRWHAAPTFNCIVPRGLSRKEGPDATRSRQSSSAFAPAPAHDQCACYVVRLR